MLTFPTLEALVGAVVANGTSTVALVLGALAGAWGYRKQLTEVRRWLLLLVPPSILGGILGTYLVILYPDEFGDLVPWLILTAALLFLIQPLVRRFLRQGAHGPPAGVLRILGVMFFQFAVAIYGGYFGAGIGILMLSGLALLGLGNIHQMNGVKNILGSCINGCSCVVWIINDRVAWHYALPMMGTAIVGGYVAAHYAQRVPGTLVRWLVIAIGFGLAGFYFWRG